CTAYSALLSEAVTHHQGLVARAFVEKVGRDISRVADFEELLPATPVRVARQDHISCHGIPSNEHLVSVEAELGGQPDRLATAIGKELGDLRLHSGPSEVYTWKYM